MSSARRRTVEQPSSARQQQQQQQHTGRSTYSSMASGRTDASVLLPGEARTSAQRVEQHRLRQGGISFNVDLNERISPRRVTKGRVHSVDEHPPQYVEWSVPSPSSRHSGDRPPTAEERQRALTARPPPPREVVYASRRSWRRFFQRLWSWLSISALLACIFGGRGRRRRDAAPPSSPSPPVAQQPHQQQQQQQTCIDDEDPGSPSSDRVSDSDRRLVAALNRLSLPLWMQRALFYIIDFLTKRRVVFVAAVVAVIVMIGITVPTTEVLGNVASVFQIAEDDRPGLRFRETYMRGREHLPHKHPVVVMPGFITSALEVWEDNLPCLRNNTSIFTSGFRQRMFGTQLLLLILKDPQCWLDLFRLDPNTGRDPRGVKIRPDSGFTSVDYFMPGFWVWARILVNLADIGYDPQSMAVLTYDWRLSPTVLHDRDGYFFQVRNNVKFLCQKNRERAVMIAHSYGALVTLAFLKWTEQREPGWMDRYVAYFINIGGTTMGIPKTVLASLVGDVRDSLDVPRPARSMLDSFVSRRKRTDFTRTWSCLVAMMPRGCSDAFPDLLVLPNGTALDMRSSAELLRRECGESGHRDCVAQVDAHLAEMEELPVLPHAPNSTVVCLYGVNKATETGYRINAEDLEQTSTGADAVLLGDGDGTVPLASLAYMCRAPNGWKKNVGRVVTVEYRHGEDATSMLKMRGGSGSGDHVDILGNHDLIETVLKIVSGVDEEGAKNDGICDVDPITGESRIIHRRVHDRITSNIDAHIQHNMGSCLAKQNHRILRTHIQKDEEKFLR